MGRRKSEKRMPPRTGEGERPFRCLRCDTRLPYADAYYCGVCKVILDQEEKRAKACPGASNPKPLEPPGE